MNDCIALNNAAIHPGFCAYEIPIAVTSARSIVPIGTSSGLILDRGDGGAIKYFEDTDGDDIPDTIRVLRRQPYINHGLAVHNNFIYASRDREVYRWPLQEFETMLGDPEIILQNINQDGAGGAPQGHTTRTLIFDDQDRLYVSVGSNGNVDPNSHRSRIRRFALQDENNDFQQGEVFADGVRNIVGMAFDKHGVLWGVENSADNLKREDLGGDIHNDNPADELNRFTENDAGMHWGYPNCFTEFELSADVAKGRGTAWAWPSFLNEGYTDEQCRTDHIAPAMALQAHSAPLGITFYEWKTDRPSQCADTAFPQWMDGYAFLAYHGSWNRDIPTGYKVVYVAMDSDGRVSGAEPVDLLGHVAPNAKWEDGFRPVDVAFDDCGRLWVTSDGSNQRGSKLVRMEYLMDDGNGTAVGDNATSTDTATPQCRSCKERESAANVRMVQVAGLLTVVSGLFLMFGMA